MSEWIKIDGKTTLTGSFEEEKPFEREDSEFADGYRPLTRFMLNDTPGDLSDESDQGLVSLLDAGSGQKEFPGDHRPHFSKESLKKLRSLSSCDEDPPDIQEEYSPSLDEEGFPVRIGFLEDPSFPQPDERSEIPIVDEKPDPIDDPVSSEGSPNPELSDQRSEIKQTDFDEEIRLIGSFADQAQNTVDQTGSDLFIEQDPEIVQVFETGPDKLISSEVRMVFPFNESKVHPGIFGHFLSLIEKRRNLSKEVIPNSDSNAEQTGSDLIESRSNDPDPVESSDPIPDEDEMKSRKERSDHGEETPGEREEFQYLWRRLTRHQRHSLSVFLESLEH